MREIGAYFAVGLLLGLTLGAALIGGARVVLGR